MTDTMNRWIAEWYANNDADIRALMRDVWEHPELGLDTEYAAKACAAFARTHGFDNVLLKCAEDYDNPDARVNTVVAEYGSGKPVIGIIGELDALPGLGQNDTPYRNPKEGPGHGCGHCLMAGGSAAAACALKYAMEKEGLKGTLRFIEAPAEEIGTGKGWLAKDGLFDDMDVALMWHAGACDLDYDPRLSVAIYDVDFRFYGKTAHAAGQPWNGRSSLDAVQLMNMGCEFLREHVVPGSYIHYNITDGGLVPNVVPDYAAVRYFFRSRSGMEGAKALYERACKVADGAALMTETTVEKHIRMTMPDLNYNIPLCRFLYESAKKIDLPQYTEEEMKFARELYRNVMGQEAPENDWEVLPMRLSEFHDHTDGVKSSATDASYMSYICPTMHSTGMGNLFQGPGHHWGLTCCAGTALGQKAAIAGYKALAQGAYDIYTHPEVTEEFWAYQKSLNLPPLDYSSLKKPE